MTRITAHLITITCLSLSIISGSWAETRQYVTDDLTIPMRTGTTINHKILKFLNSGTAVIVKEISEDGKHAWIMLADDTNKLGWVETRRLQKEPVARDRIVTINNQMASLRDKNAALKNDLQALKQQYQQLEKDNQQLEDKRQDLMHTLTRLRESAARPIETAEENTQLQKDISEQKQINEDLMRQVAALSDNNIKEWFLIGGGVAIGSLILGLLITRISWKKRESWGGSF